MALRKIKTFHRRRASPLAIHSFVSLEIFRSFRSRSASIKSNEAQWNAEGIRKRVADLSMLFQGGMTRKERKKAAFRAANYNFYGHLEEACNLECNWYSSSPLLMISSIDPNTEPRSRAYSNVSADLGCSLRAPHKRLRNPIKTC